MIIKNISIKRIVPAGIVIIYLIMSGIIYSAFYSLVGFNFIPSVSICFILFLSMVVFVLPYEKLGLIWKSKKEDGLIIVGCAWLFSTFVIPGAVIIYNKYAQIFRNTHWVVINMVALPVLYIIIYLFELVKSNVYLTIAGIIFVVSNFFAFAVAIDRFLWNDSLFSNIMVMIGISIMWCIFLLVTNRKNKGRTILFFMTSILFFGAILSTEIRSEYMFGFKMNKTLEISKDANYNFAFRHPFSVVFTYLGLIPLIILLLLFAVMTVLVVLSRKCLSKNRYMAMIGLFTLSSTIFVLGFFSDLGCTPNAAVMTNMPFFQLPFIAIMARLFVTDKIQENPMKDSKEKHSFEYQLFEEFLLLEKRVERLEYKTTETIKYLLYCEMHHWSPTKIEDEDAYKDLPKYVQELAKKLKEHEEKTNKENENGSDQKTNE